MIRKVLFALLIASAVLAGCDTKEKAVLQTKVDSLSVELEASQRVAQTMQEVGSLMDSIDASRQLLKVNMAEGTSYENYTERMKELNNFVKESQSKITALENDLKKSTSSSSSISKSVNRLKKDLESKNQEIVELQEQVEKYRNENQNLIQTVGLQEAMLEDKEGEILTKQQELALIEARIQELMIQSKMTEADAYYARAAAVEEAAGRTKLAPKKKKETLKEAVELYKKALSLGKNEAQAKIEELEKKI